MIRLPAIGAAVFALGMLALPTFALPAKDENKLTHARHARTAAGRQPGRGRHHRPGPERQRGPADHLVRQRDDRRQHGQRRAGGRQAAVQAGLRVRRGPPEPLRRLARRDPGQHRDRAALPGRPGRRDQGPARGHGHGLRPAVRRHPGRPAARRPRRLRRQLLRDRLAPCSARRRHAPGRATWSCWPTASRAARRSTGSARP